MKLKDYIIDNIVIIFLFIIINILEIVLLYLFNINSFLLFTIPLLNTLLYLISFIYKYNKKKVFYNKLENSLNNLDQKNLITEIVKEPNFLDGKKLYNYIYELNKDFLEQINKYKINSEEFKEYIELWCHEIKTPVATSKLIIENNQNKITTNINEELIKIDYYIEQVLFYAKSNDVNKDYILKKITLNDLINNIIKSNKKDLLSKKIKITCNVQDIIYSDPKWLEFIINQILINSIKYISDNPEIEITSKKNKNNVILSIRDNGIGINSEELDKVFDKGFTGSNGRKKYNSTGIGLYLCKKLCNKLGHNIIIDSKINDYTIVSIIFPISSTTDDLNN